MSGQLNFNFKDILLMVTFYSLDRLAEVTLKQYLYEGDYLELLARAKNLTLLLNELNDAITPSKVRQIDVVGPWEMLGDALELVVRTIVNVWEARDWSVTVTNFK